MCDYSLHSVRTRPAKVGEKLVTHNFGTGTRGFAAPEDCSVAVCILPVVYLNIHDLFGIRQTEAESAIELMKQKHAQSFEAIYVLWKDKVL